MAKLFWDNDGEPVEGVYTATIDLEDGSGKQVFSGTSHKDVADKLLTAQAHATSKIRELTRKITPEPARPEEAPIQPRPLTAEERMQVARDISDPAAAPEAIRMVVEAAVGAPLQRISERERAHQDQERAANAKREVDAFIADTPEYFVCAHNRDVMLGYMQFNNLALTASNYSLAFDNLKAAGLVRLKPETPALAAAAPAGGLPAPAAPPVRTRPRGTGATGLRAGDSSAAEPAPAATKYTREQIENMPSDEYRNKLTSEAGFADLVNKLYPAPAASR